MYGVGRSSDIIPGTWSLSHAPAGMPRQRESDLGCAFCLPRLLFLGVCPFCVFPVQFWSVLEEVGFASFFVVVVVSLCCRCCRLEGVERGGRLAVYACFSSLLK